MTNLEKLRKIIEEKGSTEEALNIILDELIEVDSRFNHLEKEVFNYYD